MNFIKFFIYLFLKYYYVFKFIKISNSRKMEKKDNSSYE